MSRSDGGVDFACEESQPFERTVGRESRVLDATVEELDFEEDGRTSTEDMTADIQNSPTGPHFATVRAEGEVPEVLGGEFDAAEDVEDGEIRDSSAVEYLETYSCRFYRRGSCAFGKACRFLHLSDKGLYRMFDTPVVTENVCRPVPRCRCTCQSGPEKEEEVVETAWDQALKEAVRRVKLWDGAKQKREKASTTVDDAPPTGPPSDGQKSSHEPAKRKSGSQDLHRRRSRTKRSESDSSSSKSRSRSSSRRGSRRKRCSSSSSSQPSSPMSRRVSMLERGDTRFYRIVHRREDPRSKKLAFDEKRTTSSTERVLGSRRRKGSSPKDLSGKLSGAERSRSLSDSTSHWTPKKTGSPSPAVSCSDMSISPLSDSSLSEIFEPTCERHLRDAFGRRQSDDLPDASVPKKASAPVEVYGPVYSKGTHSEAKVTSSGAPCDKLTRNSGLDGSSLLGGSKNTSNSNDGKRVNRNKVDPLERELMKFHRRRTPRPEAERCSPSGTTAMTRGGGQTPAIRCSADNKIPSKKEVLLRRLEEINAAIERKRRSNRRM